MAALSIPKLNYSSALDCRRMLTNIQLPRCFACKNPPSFFSHVTGKTLLHQPICHKQICKVTDSPDVSLEALNVLEGSDEKIGSKAEAPLVVTNIEDCIEYIKLLLNTMGDGRISVSPYDTAWVALIKDIKGCDLPQFPSCLEWIVQNQLPDGSWGDKHFFSSFDRLLNTLACVVALKSWNVHDDMSQKGISFIRENVSKLENADAEHMTCGFEVVFPALLERARNLGIYDIPYDAPPIKEIYNARDQKKKRIPKDLMHKVPTSLLFSLEGLDDLDWDKLIKLQASDGSFLTSPSSTAFAFMETKDAKCLTFITNTVEKLGGAPHTYPVDTFGRLWAIDRLQRLGISRFFEPEIEDCLSYIYRCWTNKGLFSGRDSEFCDIDDTSMGFRLLRLHGYDVDPNVFRNFKSANKFSCYGGQMIESPSPIFNLYRASQIQFPREEILQEAGKFSHKFLLEKLASDQVLDKWVISRHLSDEIRNGLEMPWYASLPRIEARIYLEHYGGAKDVWIGKTLYRMEEISNNVYLELGKLDFERCQEQHQVEWFLIQEWYKKCNAQEFRISGKDLLHAYFLATASIFEPERSKERLAWTKSHIICNMIASFFSEETTTLDQKISFISEFKNNINGVNKSKSSKGQQQLQNVLLATLQHFLQEFNKSISNQLRKAWIERLVKLQKGESNCWGDAELFVTTLNICATHTTFTENILSHPQYMALSELTNKICHHLSQIQDRKALEEDGWNGTKPSLGIEEDMQELVKLVLKASAGGIDMKIKQTFLTVAKTFYYTAYNTAEAMHVHILKVLFEPVV